MRHFDAHLGAIPPALIAILAVLTPGGLLAGVGTWTSSGPEGGDIRALASEPSNLSTVYAVSDVRVYRSVDGGGLWLPIIPVPTQVNAVLPTSTRSFVYATVIDRPYLAILYRTTDGGESWIVRSAPGSHVVSMSVDPNDPMTLYAVVAGTVPAQGPSLFRTTNGGDSWERLTNSPAGGLGAIAVDPADSTVLYLSVAGVAGFGVYRSSDRGATWTRTNLQEAPLALLFDPRDSSRLFALTTAGVQVTMNRGDSWRRIFPGEALQNPTRLAIDPANTARMYVVSGGVLFHSSDGGETASPVSEAFFGGPVETIAVSAAAVVLAGSRTGIYRSGDGGETWSAANRGIREIFVGSVAIDPTDPASLLAASSQGIYESRDGGASWREPVSGSPSANVIAIDPSNHSILYAAGSGSGVQKSTDGGRLWQNKTPLVDGRLADYIYDLVIDPNNPRRILASYESVYRSLDGTDSWSRVMTPDDDYSSYYYPPTVNAIAIAPSDSATIYAGGCCGAGFVYRSDDGGDNWSDLKTNIGWVNALAVDPCDPRIVYAGTYRGIFRSIDGGNTWNTRRLEGTSVYALAPDPRHSSSLFAGTSSGLLWTNDYGDSWIRFEPILYEPVLSIASIAIDPSGRFLHVTTGRGVSDLERTFEPCVDGPDRLCLMGSRFRVTVTASDRRTGRIGARAIREGERFGYFGFPTLTGDSSFPEVLVKMVDAIDLPPPYGGNVWVFHSALTDLDYTLTVEETQTGRIKTYLAQNSRSPFSVLTCGQADTRAFAEQCVAKTSAAAEAAVAEPAMSSNGDLSLLAGRFRARIQARDPRTGRIAEGTALPRGDGFGYFSLPGFTGDPSFPEVFVKMVDATALPGGFFWVFHTGLTDVEYTLTMTDTTNGAVRTYLRGASEDPRLCGAADTMAFRN